MNYFIHHSTPQSIPPLSNNIDEDFPKLMPLSTGHKQHRLNHCRIINHFKSNIYSDFDLNSIWKDVYRASPEALYMSGLDEKFDFLNLLREVVLHRKKEMASSTPMKVKK